MHFMSLVGVVVLLLIAVIFSRHRTKINWRGVLAALAIQITFGGFVLYSTIGQKILEVVSDAFVKFLGYARYGSEFLFGDLINQEKYDYVFALDVFPVIVYFSAVLAVLYHIGVMGAIIRFIGGFLRVCLKASPTECTAAASSIFVGNPELTVRPYLERMTVSELFVVMVAAMASISGEVVAGYVGMGIPAKYIIAASLMTGPGCILFAKMLIPETEKNTSYENVDLSTEKAANVLEAAAKGASDGIFISLNVAAMLIAFLSIIAVINAVLGWFGNLFGFDGLSMQYILGKILKYLTFVMGVPWQDTEIAGQFIGLKTITNEFVAYYDFAEKYIVKENNQFASFKDINEITGVIICFALCGYANLGSIAVYFGSIVYLAPSRRSDLAKFGLLALLASSLSNLLSATIAGFFIGLNMVS